MGKKLYLTAILIMLIFTVMGCNIVGYRDYDSNNRGNRDGNSLAREKVLSIDPEPKPEEQTITLYFKHKYSDYLVPEVRVAARDKQSWEQLVVEEIFKGPSQHDRISIMPTGVRVLDVNRKGDTVFVNLSQEFVEEINLFDIPGKEEIPEEKRSLVKAEMKRLGIYSIVNSLTELEGINQVKFLIENRAISLADMDDDLADLMFSNLEVKEEQVTNVVMVALTRDRTYILTPSKSVKVVFEGLIGEPKWDKVYSLLSKEMVGKDHLPPKDELAKRWSALVSGIEIEDNFILDEEIKPDGRAFVMVTFDIVFASGKKQKVTRDIVIVVNEDDIWKVKLPEFVSDIR